jgi:hypothetical protein
LTDISGVSGDFEFRGNSHLVSKNIKPFEFKSQRNLINQKFKGNNDGFVFKNKPNPTPVKLEKFVFKKSEEDVFVFKGADDLEIKKDFQVIHRALPQGALVMSSKSDGTVFMFQGSDDILLQAILDEANSQSRKNNQAGRFTPDGYADYSQEEFVFRDQTNNNAIVGALINGSFKGSEDIVLDDVFKIRLKMLPLGLKVMPRFRDSDGFYFFGSTDYIAQAIKDEQDQNQKVLKPNDRNLLERFVFKNDDEDKFVFLGIYSPIENQSPDSKSNNHHNNLSRDEKTSTKENFYTYNVADLKPSLSKPFEYQKIEKIITEDGKFYLKSFRRALAKKFSFDRFIKDEQANKTYIEAKKNKQAIKELQKINQAQKSIKIGFKEEVESHRLVYEPPRETKFEKKEKPVFEKRTQSIMDFDKTKNQNTPEIVFQGAETLEKKEVFRLRIRQLPPGAVCMPRQTDPDVFVVVGSSALPMEFVIEQQRDEEKFIESIISRKNSVNFSDKKKDLEKFIEKMKDSKTPIQSAFDPANLFDNSQFMSNFLAQEKFSIDRSNEQLFQQELEKKLQEEIFLTIKDSENLVLMQEDPEQTQSAFQPLGKPDPEINEFKTNEEIPQPEFSFAKSDFVFQHARVSQEAQVQSPAKKTLSESAPEPEEYQSPQRQIPVNLTTARLRNKTQKSYTATEPISDLTLSPSSSQAPTQKNIAKIAPAFSFQKIIRRVTPNDLSSLEYLKTELQTNTKKISDELIKDLDKNLIASLLIQNYKQNAAMIINPIQVQNFQNNGLVNLVSEVENSKTKNKT